MSFGFYGDVNKVSPNSDLGKLVSAVSKGNHPFQALEKIVQMDSYMDSDWFLGIGIFEENGEKIARLDVSKELTKEETETIPEKFMGKPIVIRVAEQ